MKFYNHEAIVIIFWAAIAQITTGFALNSVAAGIIVYASVLTFALPKVMIKENNFVPNPKSSPPKK